MEACAKLATVLRDEPLENVYAPEDENEPIILSREVYFWEGRGAAFAEYDTRINPSIAHFRSIIQ